MFNRVISGILNKKNNNKINKNVVVSDVDAVSFNDQFSPVLLEEEVTYLRDDVIFYDDRQADTPSTLSNSNTAVTMPSSLAEKEKSRSKSSKLNFFNSCDTEVGEKKESGQLKARYTGNNRNIQMS